ncbi:M24 family metallopeptidase [Bradyrhizobium sp. 137]|nr:M24 family metallopeptidase [Bradyrhizobium sp. 137]
MPGFKTFEDAVRAAVRAVAPKGLKLGVDGSRGAGLATLLSTEWPVLDISDAVIRSRTTKLPEELVRLRKATQLVETGIDAIRREFKIGMSEWELAGLVASEMVCGGGVPEFISLTTGPRSALADAYPTGRKIQAGDLIRLDAGCVVDGYKSDMARCFVVGDASRLITTRYRPSPRVLRRNSPQCAPEQMCATFTWRPSRQPAARAFPHIGDTTAGMALVLVDMNTRSSARRLRPF